MLRSLGLLLFTLHVQSAWGEFTSYHFPNPVGAMYDLPVGEAPGWSESTWVSLEVAASNVWNRQATFIDTRNGNTYTYLADFEQETAYANLGFALTPSLALSFEVPYIVHNSGFMDDAVDQFHILIQSDRFMRNDNRKFGNHFKIQTNGIDQLTTEHAEGVGNFKAKLKYWLWHWRAGSPGACDCGLAISGQAKFPTQRRQHGLTSGHNDYSGLVHLGVPLGANSGAWATAAITKLGANDTFLGWPRREWLQMYELTLNIGLEGNLSLILQGRADSPLFNKQYLSFNYTTSTEQEQLEEKIASGWNSLVEWRGSENIGLGWRWGKGNMVDFLFVEDWAIGTQNKAADGLYVNNAPDYQFITQWHFAF